MVKKFDSLYKRFDTIPALDGWTDRNITSMSRVILTSRQKRCQLQGLCLLTLVLGLHSRAHHSLARPKAPHRTLPLCGIILI